LFSLVTAADQPATALGYVVAKSLKLVTGSFHVLPDVNPAVKVYM